VILHVANLGHPVLRTRAQPVDPKEIKSPVFQAFLEDLKESMLFHDGAGLAGPQVFVSQRVIAVTVPPDLDPDGKGLPPAAYINPEITQVGTDREDGWEGCLSLKDLRGRVPRHREITVRALEQGGRKVELRLSGFPARVFQHEIDHLDGIVFVDRMKDMSSLCFLYELERSAHGNDEEEPQ
jgi:peptide deformylase